METDVLIVGCGCSGLYCALNLPRDKRILMITSSDAESSDSYLAQGGMCMLKDDSDYDSYFEDTLKAGHYENDKKSVEIMIRSSRDVVKDLIETGADFKKDEQGNLTYTKEGAHSSNRIIFHEDVTGKEITSHLLERVRELPNVTLLENTRMLDIISYNNECLGAVIRKSDNSLMTVKADVTVLATGGIGGLYRHSTNFRHLTGDSIAIAVKHNVELKDINYVQIHPTTFYSKDEKDRSFLISESVRGEGAKLYDKNGDRFVNELLPRDLLTQAIYEQMKKDGTDYVWEDLRTIPEAELKSHFPNIVEHCRQQGYDVTKECIPVVPAQHYFMGGIKVDYESRTSMDRLYAVGETACNGVHGRNRLASNSLLESLVFAKRAAHNMIDSELADKLNASADAYVANMKLTDYEDENALNELYAKLVKDKIDEADGYFIYSSVSGKKMKKVFDTRKRASKKKAKKSTAKSTGAKTVTYTFKKRKSGTVYQYQIRAYKLVNGKKKVFCKSMVVYSVANNQSGKLTNVKNIKLKKKSYTLQVKQTAKIKAKYTAYKKNKKLYSRVKTFRYISSNTNVATVTKVGKIKAVKAGTCTIYVLAHNGVRKAVKVTVR